jgi:hypothetical protein
MILLRYRYKQPMLRSGRFCPTLAPAPDLDPDLNYFLANFLMEIFLQKYVLKSIFINQKVKQQGFLQCFFTFTHIKKS